MKVIEIQGRTYLKDKFGGLVPFSSEQGKKEAEEFIANGHPGPDMLIAFMNRMDRTPFSGIEMTPELIQKIETHLAQCEGCYWTDVSLTIKLLKI